MRCICNFSEIAGSSSVCTFARFRLDSIRVPFGTASRSLVELSFVIRERGVSGLQYTCMHCVACVCDSISGWRFWRGLGLGLRI
jgi:hypothetical protein